MEEQSYQPFPQIGELAKNLNLSTDELGDKVIQFSKDTVYCYIVDTVEYFEGRLYQTGSGPNFQDDLITLASCKHLMRSGLDVDSWIGTWVAGFTSSRDLSRNALVYLMRVSQAFKSHREFWESESISVESKNAKAAHLDRFGDIYQPLKESGNPYLSWHYVKPLENHVHCEPGDWHQDIQFKSRYGKRASLLVGDPGHSFIWERPKIWSPVKLYRAHKKLQLEDLITKE